MILDFLQWPLSVVDGRYLFRPDSILGRYMKLWEIFGV